MSEILAAISSKQEDVENWIKRFRGQLATRFESTVRGRSRLFTRVNTYELGFLTALSASGIPISQAIAHGAALIRAKSGGGWRDWMVFPAGDAGSGIRSNMLDLPKVSKQLGDPSALTVINLGEIVRRVDAVFDEELA